MGGTVPKKAMASVRISPIKKRSLEKKVSPKKTSPKKVSPFKKETLTKEEYIYHPKKIPKKRRAKIPKNAFIPPRNELLEQIKEFIRTEKKRLREAKEKKK